MKKYLLGLFLPAIILVDIIPSYASGASNFSNHGHCSATSFDPAKLIYRLADKETDLGNLLELYNAFTPDDHHRLLVCPSGRVRKKMLGESIQAGKIFVACDPDKDGPNKIVSFCKLYIAQGSDACSTISEELSAGVFQDQAIDGSQVEALTRFEPCVPAFIKDYNLSYAAINNFDQRLQQPDLITESLLEDFATKREHGVGFDLNPNRDVILYYGSAYTLEKYRYYHINSALEFFALNYLSDGVRQHLTSGANLVYMYGVVEENFWGSARLRSFANFIWSLFSDSSGIILPLSVTIFNAKKPVFEVRGSRGVFLPSPQPKKLLSLGYPDCLLQCSLSCNSFLVDSTGLEESIKTSDSLSPLPVISPDEFIKGYGCFISCRIP
jgi:hypothetical protein